MKNAACLTNELGMNTEDTHKSIHYHIATYLSTSTSAHRSRGAKFTKRTTHPLVGLYSVYPTTLIDWDGHVTRVSDGAILFPAAGLNTVGWSREQGLYFLCRFGLIRNQIGHKSIGVNVAWTCRVVTGDSRGDWFRSRY